MRKLSAKWFPKYLNADHKRQRCRSSEQFWNFFGAIQIISCHDWWPRKKPGYITMTRRQSNNQWSGDIAAHPDPKSPLEKYSRRFFFWGGGSRRHPPHWLSSKGYYSYLLVQLKDILKENRCGNFTQGVLFLHDNAPTHQALAIQKKLAYLGLQCLDHPLYSPDLAPSDYHVFPELKNNWKIATFRPTWRSLLPRRPGWTDKILNFFWVAFKS